MLFLSYFFINFIFFLTANILSKYSKKLKSSLKFLVLVLILSIDTTLKITFESLSKNFFKSSIDISFLKFNS